MISPFAKIQQIDLLLFLYILCSEGKITLSLFITFPLLPKQFHKLREHLENIEKDKKNHVSFSILFQCLFHFSHEIYICSQNYDVYSFCIFIQLGGNENTRKEGDSSFKYLKYCHVEEMTDLFCANSKYQLEEGTTSIWQYPGKSFLFLPLPD